MDKAGLAALLQDTGYSTGDPVLDSIYGVQPLTEADLAQYLPPEAGTYGAVPTGPEPAYGETRRDTRGVRNNNPGNLNFAGQAGAVKEGGPNGRFAVFQSPEEGLNALSHQLRTYQGRGINTVGGMISKWAPPTENNTQAYISRVANALGVAPDQAIDVNDPAVMHRMMTSIIQMENGHNPYSAEQIAAAAGGAPQAQQGSNLRSFKTPSGQVISIPADIPDDEVAAKMLEQYPDQARQLGFTSPEEANLESFKTPSGQEIKVPKGLTPEQVAAKMLAQYPEQAKKLGFQPPKGPQPTYGAAAMAGLEEAGSFVSGFGAEALKRAGMAPDFASALQQKSEALHKEAGETYRPLTDEEVAQQGLAGKFHQNIGQPLVHGLTTYGIPVAATALGGELAGPLGVLGTIATGGGQVLQEAKDTGKELSNWDFAWHTGVETIANYLRVPMGKLAPLASRLGDVEKKEVLNLINAGNVDAAVQKAGSYLGQVGKAILSTGATAGAGSALSEANRIAVEGGDLTSPESGQRVLEAGKAGAIAMTPLGAVHGHLGQTGRRAEIETLVRGKQDLDRQLGQSQQERDLAGEVDEEGYTPEEREILTRARQHAEQPPGPPTPPAPPAPPAPPEPPKQQEEVTPPAPPAPPEPPKQQEEVIPPEPPKQQEEVTPPEPVDLTKATREDIETNLTKLNEQSNAFMDANDYDNYDLVQDAIKAHETELRRRDAEDMAAKAPEGKKEEVKAPPEPPKQEAAAPAPTPEIGHFVERLKFKKPGANLRKRLAKLDPNNPEDLRYALNQLHSITEAELPGVEALRQDLNRALANQPPLSPLAGVPKKVAPTEAPSAQQIPETGAPDGSGGAQPILREEGGDQAVSGKGVEPSGQGKQAAEEDLFTTTPKEEVAPTYEEILQHILTHGPSASLLQRKFSIPLEEVKSVLDRAQQEGYISEPDKWGLRTALKKTVEPPKAPEPPKETAKTPEPPKAPEPFKEPETRAELEEALSNMHKNTKLVELTGDAGLYDDHLRTIERYAEKLRRMDEEEAAKAVGEPSKEEAHPGEEAAIATHAAETLPRRRGRQPLTPEQKKARRLAKEQAAALKREKKAADKLAKETATKQNRVGKGGKTGKELYDATQAEHDEKIAKYTAERDAFEKPADDLFKTDPIEWSDNDIGWVGSHIKRLTAQHDKLAHTRDSWTVPEEIATKAGEDAQAKLNSIEALERKYREARLAQHKREVEKAPKTSLKMSEEQEREYQERLREDNQRKFEAERKMREAQQKAEEAAHELWEDLREDKHVPWSDMAPRSQAYWRTSVGQMAREGRTPTKADVKKQQNMHEIEALTLEVEPKVEPKVETKAEPVQPKGPPPEWVTKLTKRVGGRSIYHDNDIALVKTWSPLETWVYIGVKGDNYFTQDIDSIDPSKNVGTFTAEEIERLRAEKQKHITEDEAATVANSDGPFQKGARLHFTKSVPKEIQEIVRQWQNMLGISERIHVATLDDALATEGAENYHGAFDNIYMQARNNAATDSAGSNKPLGNGDFSIVYTPHARMSKVLETLSHEMGHVLEQTTYERADDATKAAIRADYEKWLADTKGIEYAKDFVQTLRAHTTGKLSKMDGGLKTQDMAKLHTYWRSFGEWFADQTSRWATTDERPLSVVEKFFSRLANALKSFFLKNKQYLPSKNFSSWVNTLGESDVVPAEIAKLKTPKSGVTEALRTPVNEDAKLLRSAKLTRTLPPEHVMLKKQAVETLDTLRKPGAFSNLFANLRYNLVDKGAKLAHALRDDPTFSDGKFRADLLLSQYGHLNQFVSEGIRLGVPFVSDTGMMRISYDPKKNLVSILDRANSLPDGLGPDDLANVLRAIVGEHWMKEPERLRERIGTLKGQIRDVQAYANTLSGEAKNAAMRTLRMLRNELDDHQARLDKIPETGLEAKVTQEHIDAAKRLMESSPKLKELVDDVHGVMRGLVDLHEQVGLINAKVAREWRKAPYIPLYMTMEDLAARGEGPHITGGSKRLRSTYEKWLSDHEVNVFENLQKHYFRMTQVAFQNNVRRASLDQMRRWGMAERMDREPSAQESKKLIQTKENGREIYHKVDDPYIFDALNFQSHDPLPTFLTDPSKAFSRLTLMNPGYWIKQLVRDPLVANFVSKTGMITPLGAARSFLQIVSGRSAEYDILRSHGVTGLVDAMNDSVRYSQAAGKPGMLRRSWDKWKHVHEAADAATRVEVFKQAMKEAKKKGLTGDAAEDFAVMRAREIINFSNQGAHKAVNFMARTVPFFSAGLNSLDVIMRNALGTDLPHAEAKEARKIFRNRAMAMTALSTAYAYNMAMNSQAYRDASDNDKMGAWLIEPPEGWGWQKGRMIKIPIPFEIGFLFKSLPELAVNNLLGLTSPEKTGEMAWESFKQTFPVQPFLGFGLVPTIMKPMLEVATNYNLFGKYGIESPATQKELVEFRGAEKASMLANWLAQHSPERMQMSPAKWDHLLAGYFSELYKTSMLIADAVLEPEARREAKDITEKVPFARPFVSNPNHISDADDFYDMKSQVEEWRNSIMSARSQGNIQRFEELMGRPGALERFGASSAFNKQGEILSKLEQYRQRIINSPMPSEQRQELLRQNQMYKQQILKYFGNMSKDMNERIREQEEAAEEDEE